MRPGGKARLFCPAQTAYGARGIPGTIPPNSVLIFDVELLGIE
jgi:FKBP-type peptidyl-prolyl cis-trans isomerase FkpA